MRAATLLPAGLDRRHALPTLVLATVDMENAILFLSYPLYRDKGITQQQLAGERFACFRVAAPRSTEGSDKLIATEG
jgi:hypothetical protein